MSNEKVEVPLRLLRIHLRSTSSVSRAQAGEQLRSLLPPDDPKPLEIRDLEMRPWTMLRNGAASSGFQIARLGSLHLHVLASFSPKEAVMIRDWLSELIDE